MIQSVDTEGIVSQLLQSIDTDALYSGILRTTGTEGLASVDIGGIVSGTEAGLSKTSQSMDMCDLVLGIFLSFCII